MQLHISVNLDAIASKCYKAAMRENPEDPMISAWIGLVRAQSRILAAVESGLKEAGHPPLGWYDVLLELQRAPEGLRPLDLQSRLLLEQHNVSRLIDRMAAKGLVERRPCETDGRGQIIALTGKGKEQQRAMWPIYRAALNKALASRLSTAEAVALSGLLAKLS
jgi:DNA-binding MarR family transcriptional regulator